MKTKMKKMEIWGVTPPIFAVHRGGWLKPLSVTIYNIGQQVCYSFWKPTSNLQSPQAANGRTEKQNEKQCVAAAAGF